MRWILTLVFVLNLGCIGVDITGIEGFSGGSAHWVVAVDGTLRTHSLKLSDSVNYCADLQAAEQERIDATARAQQRIDDGAGACESEDLFRDDIAAVQANLEYDGAALLSLTLDKGEDLSDDARTAPEAGDYEQRRCADTPCFGGDLVYFNGGLAQASADAYQCDDPDTFNVDMLDQFLGGEAIDFVDRWTLDSGELTLASGGDDAWEVTVSGDLLDGGSNSVGTVSTSFTAAKCEVQRGE